MCLAVETPRHAARRSSIESLPTIWPARKVGAAFRLPSKECEFAWLAFARNNS
jgi:hypothetical protein